MKTQNKSTFHETRQAVLESRIEENAKQLTSKYSSSLLSCQLQLLIEVMNYHKRVGTDLAKVNTENKARELLFLYVEALYEGTYTRKENIERITVPTAAVKSKLVTNENIKYERVTACYDLYAINNNAEVRGKRTKVRIIAGVNHRDEIEYTSSHPCIPYILIECLSKTIEYIL